MHRLTRWSAWAFVILLLGSFGVMPAAAQVPDDAPPQIYLPSIFGAAQPDAQPLEPEHPFAASTVLVGYKLVVSAAELDAVRAAAQSSVQALTVEPLSPLAGDAEKIRLAPGISVEQAIATLNANPGVLYAEPDYLLQADSSANDPLYTNGSQWDMYGDTDLTPASVSLYNQYGSQANEAWAAYYTGWDTVYVGIIDQGVDYLHEDLAANIWVNPFDPVDGVDNDGNGYKDDIHGWDFYHEDSSTFDAADGDAHGTHVAGTIGAVGNNEKGVAGINWDVQLITTKFLGPTGGYTSDAVQALDYLTALKRDHGLNIVATNNSWGGGGSSASLLAAINRSGDAGILFVAAAGNGGTDQVGDNNNLVANYPSNYACTNGGTRGWDCVIAVAAITSSGARAGFSNFGSTTVDLGAPGYGIMSTLPNNTYGSYSGTSMATPHVTGAAALCAAISLSPIPSVAGSGLSAAEIRAAILAAAAPTSSLASSTVTGGRLDIGAMVSRCQPKVPPPPPTPPSAPENLVATALSSSQIKLTWSDVATNEDGYKVERSLDGETYTPVITLNANSNTYQDNGLAMNTPYYYKVYAYNGGGNSDFASVQTATPSATAMMVQSGTIKLTKTLRGFVGTVTIKIVNGSGAPIASAAVTGDWYKNTTKFLTKSSNTNSAGTATITTSAFTAAKGTAVKFCITSITKSGYALATPLPLCSNVLTTW